MQGFLQDPGTLRWVCLHLAGPTWDCRILWGSVLLFDLLPTVAWMTALLRRADGAGWPKTDGLYLLALPRV